VEGRVLDRPAHGSSSKRKC